jgi:hypothetical protein
MSNLNPKTMRPGVSHFRDMHPRWIFIHGDNKPESRFLDKFKRLALRAGVNCGHCLTTRNEGRYEKKPVQVSCKTHPVCEKIILQRLSKTKATPESQLHVGEAIASRSRKRQ